MRLEEGIKRTNLYFNTLEKMELRQGILKNHLILDM